MKHSRIRGIAAEELARAEWVLEGGNHRPKELNQANFDSETWIGWELNKGQQ